MNKHTFLRLSMTAAMAVASAVTLRGCVENPILVSAGIRRCASSRVTGALVTYHGHEPGELFDLMKDPQEFEIQWDNPAYAAVCFDLTQRPGTGLLRRSLCATKGSSTH